MDKDCVSSKSLMVVIEGPDFCGKTTVAKQLVQELQSIGISAAYVRFPGATAVGESIRELLVSGPRVGGVAELLLFLADAAAFLEQRRSSPGTVFVCDRFSTSTQVYQGLSSAGVFTLPSVDISDTHEVRRLLDAGIKEGPVPSFLAAIYDLFRQQQFALPDHVFLLDIAPAEIRRRAGDREHNEFDSIILRPGITELIVQAYREAVPEGTTVIPVDDKSDARDTARFMLRLLGCAR